MTEHSRFNLFSAEQKVYSNQDKAGKYRVEEIVQRRNLGSLRRDTMLYPVLGISPKEGYRWQLSQKKYDELSVKKRLKLINKKPYKIIYDFEEDNFAFEPFYSHLERIGTAEGGKAELNEILGINHGFETVKPVELIKKIIFHSTDKDSIILDSFAGSGTTAHSVLDLNKEDGGNRKFILVEMEDYADKITAERVRRVIKRYADAEIYPNPPLQKEGAEKSSFAKGGSEEIPLNPPLRKGESKEVSLLRKGESENPPSPSFMKGGKQIFPPLEKGARGIFSPTFSYFELGKPIEMESILSGKNLPTYKELARYVFYTATGEEFDEEVLSIPPLEKGARGISENFIGESKEYRVYLFYKPDIEYLKNIALTLDRAKALGKYAGKKRLIFAPTKYLDQDHLDQLRIDFAQLPFEIYKLTE